MAKSKREKKDYQRLKLWLSLALLLVAILFVGSLYAAYHRQLSIAQIMIEGNKTVSDFEVRQVVNKQLSGKYWWLYPKRNALLFPREEVIAAVASAFPRLSSIKLEQPNLQSLSLSVKERKGEFLWCLPTGQAGLREDDCYFADDTGFVFAPAPKFSRPLYFELWSSSTADPLGNYALPPTDWQKLIMGQRELAAIFLTSPFENQKIYQARPAELRDWYFQVRDDSGTTWEIRLDLNQDFPLAFKTLRSFLVNPDFVAELPDRGLDLEYLDLRFAPKVFYRYNNQ